MNDESVRLAKGIRDALVQGALTAYEDAALQGLCCEGAWEAAVSAMRGLDLSPRARDPLALLGAGTSLRSG